MGGFYIILGIMGITCVILSFMLSERLEGHMSKENASLTEEQLQVFLNSNQDALEKALTMHAQQTKEAAMEETERVLARLTNEKIMAVDEFSDTVLEKINQNHSEVIFLYDMLNEKEKELKELVSTINQTVHSGAAEREKLVEKKTVVKEHDTAGRRSSQKQQDRKSRGKEIKLQLSEQEKKQEADMRKEILNLHEKGVSVTDIAQQLKIGKGEVKLIIDLYQGAR